MELKCLKLFEAERDRSPSPLKEDIINRLIQSEVGTLVLAA